MKYVKLMAVIYFMTNMHELHTQELRDIVKMNDDDIFRIYDRDFMGVSSCFNMLHQTGLIKESFEDFVVENLNNNKTNSFDVILRAQDIIFKKIYKKIGLIFSDRSKTFEQITDPVFEAIVLHRDDHFMNRELKTMFDTPSLFSDLTNIQLSVQHGHIKEAKMFAAMGANLQVKDSNGNSLLHCVIVSQNELLDSLKQCKLSANSKKCSISNYNEEEIRNFKKVSNLNKIAIFLLDAGAKVDELNNDQNAPLHLVAFNGSDIMARTLLDHNANFNLQDSNGQTALQIASLCNNAGVTNELIRAGAQLKKKNKRKI